MADANKTLITRADITSIIASGTGRVALVIDGATVELGNSGLRELPLGAGATSGRIYMQRIGNEVEVQLDAVVFGSGSIGSVTGRAAPRVAKFMPIRATTGTEVARLGVAVTSGTISLLNGVAGQTYSGVLKYQTDAAWWDTSVPLPGVAYGQPLVV